jgi:hypothetical protein
VLYLGCYDNDEDCGDDGAEEVVIRQHLAQLVSLVVIRSFNKRQVSHSNVRCGYLPVLLNYKPQRYDTRAGSAKECQIARHLVGQCQYRFYMSYFSFAKFDFSCMP